jgi:ParB family chromosome partitioning protein
VKEQHIERIPIDQIHIANPRSRSMGKWQIIVANIREVGLKKPITVVRRKEPNGDGKQFDLVCGQGRIEAFVALGEKTIPAVITEISREDQYLMSLVENIARRPPSNRDIIREVRTLREGFVMGLEQRGRVRLWHHRNNWKQDELDACDKQTIQYR